MTATTHDAQTTLDDIGEPEEGGAPQPPEPGIYPNLDDETYYGADAVGSSMLGRAHDADTVSKFAYDEESESESSAALDVGDALHKAVLEPDKWKDIRDFPSHPHPDLHHYRDKAARARAEGADWDETSERAGVSVSKCREYLRDDKVQEVRDYYEETGGDDPPLDDDEIATVQRMRDAIFHHETSDLRTPDPAELLHGIDVEVALFDRRWGLPIRGRLDLLDHDRQYAADIKTVDGDRHTAANEWHMPGGGYGFPHAVDEWGYGMQAALYRDMWLRLASDSDEPVYPDFAFYWIVVEKAPPHEVAVYELPTGDDSWCKQGRKRCEKAAETVRKYRRGELEGYRDGGTLSAHPYR